MQKIFKYSMLVAFVCFSFMYVDAYVKGDTVNNEIMQMIRLEKNNKYQSPQGIINITDDQIMVGYFGRRVNIRKSYNNMRRAGVYDESLFVFDMIPPANSAKNHLDKYVVRGNPLRTGVSLIFRTNNIGDIEVIKEILAKREISVTFITTANINSDEHEIVSPLNNNFCYTEEINQRILDNCRKKGIMTVKPVVVDNNLYTNARTSAKTGSLMAISVNQDNINELLVTIDYILGRGYNIVSLGSHINERN